VVLCDKQRTISQLGTRSVPGCRVDYQFELGWRWMFAKHCHLNYQLLGEGHTGGCTFIKMFATT